MNFELISNIRTRTAERLLRTISVKSMHYNLIGLFTDRTAIDTTLRRFINVDYENRIYESSDGVHVEKPINYYNCLCLNDESTIAFHQSWKQDSYIFDEKRQIWIDEKVDSVKDDLFIPKGDEQ